MILTILIQIPQKFPGIPNFWYEIHSTLRGASVSPASLHGVAPPGVPGTMIGQSLGQRRCSNSFEGCQVGKLLLHGYVGVFFLMLNDRIN